MTALAVPWEGGRGPWNRGIFPTVQFPQTPSVVWKAFLGNDLTSLAPTNTLIYGKEVVAGFGQVLIAFATDTGEGLWFSKLTDLKLVGDLILLDDQIVVTYESGLVEGRNPGDGKVLWATKLSSGLRNGPTYDESTLYYTTKAKTVEALERGTGKKLGVLPVGENIEAAPLSFGKTMLLCCTNGLARRVDQVGRDTGTVRWTFQIPNAVVSLTPATDGRVVVINTPKTLVALNPFDRTNPVRWMRPLTSQLHESATMDDDRLFIATYNNRVLAIDLATGGNLWKTSDTAAGGSSAKVTEGVPVPATPIGAPVVIGKQLLVRMDNGLIALLDKSSGKLNWVYRLKAPEGAPAPTRGYYAGEPAVDGDHVYFAGSDGVMYHLSASSPDVDPPTFDNITPKITDKGFLDAKSLDAVSVNILDEGSGFPADQVFIKLDSYDLTARKQFDAKTGLFTAKLGSDITLAPG
ncbi:MAG TPA: PQQ-binding-like beta-propeller repeat protein, partial [Armatimonadota bacterium]